jgi:hypothetical protein
MKTRVRQSTFPIELDHLSPTLALNGRNIPFVNNVKYLGVIFDEKIAWKLHIEMMGAKTLKHLLMYIPYSKASN